MSIRQLRQGIRSWLSALVRIDVWDLDLPANVPTVIGGKRYPANTAVELPVEDFSLRRTNGYLEASGKFCYAILYRFAGKAAKEQLPVKAVESLVGYLCERAVVDRSEIWEDILDLEVSQVPDPVKLARVEGEDGDWLIIARLEFNIDFISNAAADFDNLQPPTTEPDPVPITRITIGLNRSEVPQVKPSDPSTFVFDRLITIPIEED